MILVVYHYPSTLGNVECCDLELTKSDDGIGSDYTKGQSSDGLSLRHCPQQSHSSRNLRGLLLEVSHFPFSFPLSCVRVFLRIGLRGRCDGLHRTRLLRSDPQLHLSRCRGRGSTAGRREPQPSDVRMPDFPLPVGVRGGGNCDNSATLWAIAEDRLAAGFPGNGLS
jgi:hypothetical protein